MGNQSNLNVLFLTIVTLFHVSSPYRMDGGRGGECVSYESLYHLDNGCKCLLVESIDTIQGTFTSPNYPLSYPANISCILFIFIADLKQIVRISFEDFDLPPPVLTPYHPFHTRCADFLNIFSDLQRPELHSDSIPTQRFCGSLINQSSFPSSSFLSFPTSSTATQNLEQNKPFVPNSFLSNRDFKHKSSLPLYTNSVVKSLNRCLIAEFHSGIQKTTNYRGFKGKFTFNQIADFGVGTRRLDSECTYDFYSAEIPQKQGVLYYAATPLKRSHKAKYKKEKQTYNEKNRPEKESNENSTSETENTINENECRYYFHGLADEKVVLNITNLQLKLRNSSSLSCNESGDDTINIYDGSNKKTLMMTLCENKFVKKTVFVTTKNSMLLVYRPPEHSSYTSAPYPKFHTSQINSKNQFSHNSHTETVDSINKRLNKKKTHKEFKFVAFFHFEKYIASTKPPTISLKTTLPFSTFSPMRTFDKPLNYINLQEMLPSHSSFNSHLKECNVTIRSSRSSEGILSSRPPYQKTSMCEYYLVPDLKNLQTFNNIKKSTTDQQLKNKFSHKTQNFKQFSHQMINQNNIQQTKKILPIVLNEKGTTNNFNQISPHLHQNSENNLINDQQHSNFIPQQIKITFLNSGNPPQTTPNADCSKQESVLIFVATPKIFSNTSSSSPYSSSSPWLWEELERYCHNKKSFSIMTSSFLLKLQFVTTLFDGNILHHKSHSAYSSPTTNSSVFFTKPTFYFSYVTHKKNYSTFQNFGNSLHLSARNSINHSYFPLNKTLNFSKLNTKSTTILQFNSSFSISPLMQKSQSHSSPLFNLGQSTFQGFKAKYIFLTDFGIKSGEQTSPGECSFKYNSTKSKNGYFHTPNYPHKYPRNVLCHYKFHANPGEKVVVLFKHFDVEGVMPRCGADSMSDSVRLSNLLWPSTDIRLPPICNKASDNHKVFKKFVSDGSFFMVTFQSNNKFDGTGFYASYNFIQSPEKRRQSGLRSQSRSTTTSYVVVINLIFALKEILINN